MSSSTPAEAIDRVVALRRSGKRTRLAAQLELKRLREASGSRGGYPGGVRTPAARGRSASGAQFAYEASK
jgi:hypothetical protein